MAQEVKIAVAVLHTLKCCCTDVADAVQGHTAAAADPAVVQDGTPMQVLGDPSRANQATPVPDTDARASTQAWTMNIELRL